MVTFLRLQHLVGELFGAVAFFIFFLQTFLKLHKQQKIEK